MGRFAPSSSSDVLNSCSNSSPQVAHSLLSLCVADGSEIQELDWHPSDESGLGAMVAELPLGVRPRSAADVVVEVSPHHVSVSLNGGKTQYFAAPYQVNTDT